MALKFAVLGVIQQGPLHGYEIKKIFSASFARLWRVSPGHLYPLLGKIVEEGLAKKTVIAQEGKPDAHQYSITTKGRKVFQQWLDTSADSLPLIRYEFMLKLFFYAQKDRELAVNEVRRLYANHQAFIEELSTSKKSIASLADNYQLLIFDGGIQMAKGGMRWLKQIEAALLTEEQQ